MLKKSLNSLTEPITTFSQIKISMTNEQILELAKEHLEEFDRGQLIEFAREIAKIEYNRGWKDREELEYSNRLNIGNTPIVPDETMEELLKNGVKK